MSAPKATREYIVLELYVPLVVADAKEAAWREVGAYLAHDDDAAVRYHIAESGAEAGTYRAVVRSAWEPLIRIKVIKTTKLTLEHGEAKRRKVADVTGLAKADPLLAGVAAALEGAPA